MASLQLFRLSFYIIFLVFITQAFSQRWYNRRRPYWRPNFEPCPDTRTCLPWNRCPPSRRPSWRDAQECSYEFYSRSNPGVCCLNRRRPPVFVPQTSRYPTVNSGFIGTTSQTVESTSQAVESTSRSPRSLVPEFLTARQTYVANNPPERNCGISQSTEGMVIGGSLARQGVWPWMVSFTVSQRGQQIPFCSGALLDRRHILSAAHCFNRTNPTIYSARIGNVDQRLSQVYSVERIDTPEGYTPGFFYNDVAIVTLTREVATPDFMPICLPRANTRNLTGVGTTLAGWGAVRLGGSNVNLLQQLHDIPVISNYQCNQAFRSILTNFRDQFPRGITNSFICAGFSEGGKDGCSGDSGGPLMFPEGGQWYVVGIVSYGYSCALANVPGGYTRVSSFIDFIRMNSENDL